MKPFEFQSVLFNFHDVILLMTFMQCLFFAALLYVTNTNSKKSTLFLAAFLVAHALIPLNELIMWGADFKAQVRFEWPSLYFLPGVAYYLDGVLLFLCIKSLVFRDFTFRKVDCLHLVPLVLYVILISSSFYSHSFEQRQLMLETETFVYSAGYLSMEMFSKSLRVFYAIACFILIMRYQHLLRDTQSSIEEVHITWLKGLVIGFMLVMFSESVLVAAKIINLFDPFANGLFMVMGLTGNYASFALVNLLIFTAIRHFLTFEQVNDEEPSKKPCDDEFVNPEMAQKVVAKMLKSRAYLEPDITLYKLAESLSILPRDLSLLINRHFGINFYEFINKYRIEEAKKMLLAPEHKNTTITDIYLDVGFNSKSVFYTFFKKFEGVTPSKYRQSATPANQLELANQ